MTRPARLRPAGAALTACLLTLAGSGCGTTVDDLPMPKPGIGGPGYVVHAQFRDALNLPGSAHVKIGGTDIGTVTSITASDFVADVQLLIRDDIDLPRGTVAELRQATPLGDMFVAITLPAAADSGPPLRSGDVIDLAHTSTAASVEQMMMSVSMLVNGGGINQAADIATQVNSMTDGRGRQLAHLMTELTDVTTALNRRTGDIDALLTGIDSLTGEMARRKAELGAAADTFPPMLGILADNQQRIVELMSTVSVATAALGDFAGSTGPAAESMFESVRALMSGFGRMGDDLTGTLDGLHQVYPGMMASLEGPALAVAATVSYLDIGALTDPNGSRLPELGDVSAFVGSLAQVLAKVFGRVTSPPRPAPAPAAAEPPAPGEGGR